MLNYQFKEKELPEAFCQDTYKKVCTYLATRRSFTFIGMPSVATSSFLKYLVTKPLAYFVYVDLYTLSTPSILEFFRVLLKELGGTTTPSSEQELITDCKEQLQLLSQKHESIVIIINRFGELEKSFSKQFFGTLRTMRHVASNKIITIFSVTRPFVESSPEALQGGNLQLFSEYLYFTPLSENDLLSLLRLYSPELITDTMWFKQAQMLSGGHLQLLQLLLKTERQANLLRDPYIRLLLSELIANVSSPQQAILEKVALGKKVVMDPYLLKTGFVVENNTTFQLFSPLLAELLREEKRHQLPAKESALFSILQEQDGGIVSKEEIIQRIWKDEAVSDWALDSLIYRLRRHPFFLKSGYTLESYKKQGYVLVRK